MDYTEDECPSGEVVLIIGVGDKMSHSLAGYGGCVWKLVRILSLAVTVCATTAGRADEGDTPKPQAAYLAVTVLSKGRGVPESAWSAYQQIRLLVEKRQASNPSLEFSETVIGLEGERRLCIVSSDPRVIEGLSEEISAMIRDTELVRISCQPCTGGGER